MKLYHLEWYDSDWAEKRASILYKNRDVAVDAAFRLAQKEYRINEKSPDGNYKRCYSDYRMSITITIIDLEGPDDWYYEI